MKLILHTGLCPGDVMTLTAAIESLHSTYPCEYETDVRSPVPAIWIHNPHITPLTVQNDVNVIEMNYDTIHQSNQTGAQFLAGYTEYLGRQIGRPLSLRVNRPYLYLSQEEQGWRNQISQNFTDGHDVPFWLVCAGIKNDYTCKAWPLSYYQEVVDATIGRIQWVQVGAKEHKHPKLERVIDLRGKTDHRQLIRLAYHCSGGLGPVTYLQHLCAAWEKPYVCLVGGREPVTWVQYPLQHTLHTIGLLDCCKTKACWKSRVVKLPGADPKNNSLCEQPILGFDRPVARCMAMIKPLDVVCVLERIAA